MALSAAIRYEGSRIASLIHVPSPYVTEARNKIVKRFLTKTKASHLLMVDVDLEFPEDSISKTYYVMKKENAGVIFGTYALGDFRPSIFGFPEKGNHLPLVSQELEHGQTYEIYAGSTGWLMMTRQAAMTIWKANEGRHWPWFDHDIEVADQLKGGELWKEENNTLRIGEDFTFSKRAREAGIKLYGTTLPILIHDKVQPLLPEFQEKAAREMGFAINSLGEKNAGSIREDEKQIQPPGLEPQSSEEEGCQDIQLSQREPPSSD